jgi:hypothetical protein
MISSSLLAAWKELSEQIVRFEQRAIEHPGLSPYHPETRQLAEAIPALLAEVERLRALLVEACDIATRVIAHSQGVPSADADRIAAIKQEVAGE